MGITTNFVGVREDGSKVISHNDSQLTPIYFMIEKGGILGLDTFL